MADNILFTNDASALLSASINDTDTTIALETGFGALFPNPTGSQYFMAALQNAAGDLELVQVTARATDSLTVVRGQEGTTAQAWTLGVTRCELRLTKETAEEFVQKNGGTMAGALDMNTQSLTDATIDGTNTKMTEGQIVGVPLRGTVDDSSNEISVPDDGTRALASGSAIRTAADNGLTYLPINSIIMWYGTLGSLPSGWQNCDGTNGTPDLRGSFPRGAGGAVAVGATGGSATASGSTGAGGGHTPTGLAASHVLTEAEMPAHSHKLWGDTSTATTDTSGLGASDAESVAGRTANVSNSFIALAGDDSAPLVETVGGDGGHTHTVAMDAVADHTHTLASVSTVPPFVGVYFIMRVT